MRFEISARCGPVMKSGGVNPKKNAPRRKKIRAPFRGGPGVRVRPFKGSPPHWVGGPISWGSSGRVLDQERETGLKSILEGLETHSEGVSFKISTPKKSRKTMCRDGKSSPTLFPEEGLSSLNKIETKG